MGNKPSNSNKSVVKNSTTRPSGPIGCNSTVPATLSHCPFDSTIHECCRKTDGTDGRPNNRLKEKATNRTPLAFHCQGALCEKHHGALTSNSIYPLIMAEDTIPLMAKKRTPVNKTSTGSNSNASCVASRAGSANKYHSDQNFCQSGLGYPHTEAQLYRLADCKRSGRRKARTKMGHVPECQVYEQNTHSQTLVQSSGSRNSIGPLFAAVPSLQRLKDLLETFSSLFSVLPDDLRNSNEKLLDFQLLSFGDEDSIQAFSSSLNSMLATMRNLIPSLERHIFVAQDLSYALHRLEERMATFHKLLTQMKTRQAAIKY
ncbi:unnamed protein product [Dicrocoelium dendriticum]|nr:unnamed protein product [Dicrocoelium dendriticum]